MRLDLLERGLVDERADLDAVREAVGDLEPLDRRGEPLEEGVVDPAWTSIRFAEMQVCPEFRNLQTIAASTAISRSASSKTMKGALPPSSNEIFLT